MIFDDETQKAQVLKLVLNSKRKVKVKGILAGASDSLKDLVKAIIEAKVEPRS
jgi:hypothetical protein